METNGVGGYDGGVMPRVWVHDGFVGLNLVGVGYGARQVGNHSQPCWLAWPNRAPAMSRTVFHLPDRSEMIARRIRDRMGAIIDALMVVMST